MFFFRRDALKEQFGKDHTVCACGCLLKMSLRWVSEKHNQVRGANSGRGTSALLQRSYTQLLDTLPGGGFYLLVHILFAWPGSGFYLHKLSTMVVLIKDDLRPKPSDFETQKMGYPGDKMFEA